MDASVQRVHPEPVVTGLRGTSRQPERQKRQGQRRGEEQPQFPLDAPLANGPTLHIEPHSPKGDGLGEKLDVIA